AWYNRLVDMLVSPSQPFSKPRRTKHVQLYFATTSTQLPDEPESYVTHCAVRYAEFFFAAITAIAKVKE
ncbi:MAG: hypothetical protein WBG50_02350, partial [Desulfomonilaceae bacterium]